MPKRAAPSSLNPSKKRKIGAVSKSAATSRRPKKNKQSENPATKDSIPIPVNDDEDVDLSDQDHTLLTEYGDGASFLRVLDRKGIARSKQEVKRLHRINKPPIRTSTLDDLPSVQSSDEGTVDSASESPSDLEEVYERAPRKRPSPERHVVERLPIKLTDGRLIKTGVRDLPNSDDTTDDDVDQPERDDDIPSYKVEDVSTGARFGRPAVLDVVGQTVRKHRIAAAKEQIASICQEIIADPENSLGLLKRLHTFSQKEISSANHPKPMLNDPIIRKLAILSQLAVFRDVIPGYRIRELTAKEAAEKVGQEVARLREWEQGLVIAYQNYLRCLEAELKARSELAETTLKCMCSLLADVTHFNFRANLMACVVGQLSRRSWTKISDLCLNTINSVFRADTTGEPSLEIVRILNRMIRERRFQIHPNVLACLLHLRLKSELNVRASETKADNAGAAVPRSKKHAKGKAADQPHLSKKAKKTLKERKEIEKEFREAAAEVDKEKRAATQTETLKLLFTIYFRILKSPTPTPLLPAALHGISKFAHLVNVDFFKDLMAVLKSIIISDSQGDDKRDDTDRLRIRLLCIVTAFELLSGQGEALNVDLTDFVARLYGLVLPLSLIPDVDVPCSSGNDAYSGLNIADLFFDALGFVFSPRSFGAAPPPWRSAAFSKRLLTASLSWPPHTAHRALQFVGGLVSKEPKLDALLSTEDQIYDGIYQPQVNDPQLCHPFGTCFWELQALRNHWDARIREEANKLCQFTRP
ncbi:hypothetical protein M378DRAFT_7539 [Amanita muscaria Koide BX008]|uniref:Nucleolar complex-associated protein 3 n=1 Tax=Amanita muscaria (strain Koide BX008) TaxID=946122 RepID=A0A0C2XJP2_AMAMK|nr:hypothetical protein M378DRAFT_7539 [Amanita muscaria Koide BX008]